jgi:hypothetical protein
MTGDDMESYDVVGRPAMGTSAGRTDDVDAGILTHRTFMVSYLESVHSKVRFPHISSIPEARMCPCVTRTT